MNLPGVSLVAVALAATYGQLAPARQAVRELLVIQPDYAAVARQELDKWFDADMVQHLLQGLGKASLDVATDAAGADPSVQA